VTSYYVTAETDTVEEVKKMLSYKKEVLRCVFFAMKATQKYMTLEKASEDVATLVESDEWTMKKRLTLFADGKNEEYLIWKAIPLLTKFVTRFGDIKPRKYTGITVSQQKKLRIAVQRAREL
jgi:ribosomal protein S18